MKKKRKFIDEEIKRLEALLQETSYEKELYEQLLNMLERLYKLRERYSWRHKIDPNVAITTSVSLVGIVMILQFERLGVISSKAIGFIRKF